MAHSWIENGAKDLQEESELMNFKEGNEIYNTKQNIVTSTRETWGKKLDFLMCLLGFAIGLGNVWRFPYLCYKNGGGAFLIPYFVSVAVGGFPLLLLEVTLGQFMSQGGIHIWSICPIFKGIGWAAAIIVFFSNCYYGVILAWAFYYLFGSFSSEVPWNSCKNHWNTPDCNDHKYIVPDKTNYSDGYSTTGISYNTSNISMKSIDPVTEYWENKVLGISSSLEEIGGIKWDIALCLFLMWLLTLACISKGVKSTGKVVYFTAIAPYIVMSILLIRGCTLPGASQGIFYYVVPNFKKILSLQVWVDAGTQVFFSYGIAIGCHMALGSYNKWNHNSYRDAIIYVIMNSFTSIFAGFIIFSVLGFMAHEAGVDVSVVAESGPGLVFQVYPKAVAQIPISPLWSILFFLMLILLGLDSQFICVEAFVTVIQDTFPAIRKTWQRKTCLLVITVSVNFAIGLTMCTRGGMYIFQLFDYYFTNRTLVLVGLLECIAVAWIYGVNRFYDNLEMMFGFRITFLMKICWTTLTPIFCLVMIMFVMSTVSYGDLTYIRPSGIYIFPKWSVVIGWVVSLIPIVVTILTAMFKVIKCLQHHRSLKTLLQPEELKPHQLRPQDKILTIGAEHVN